MINLEKTSNVRLPQKVLDKQMEVDFLDNVKAYLSIGYPDYELMYVHGNFAVCLMKQPMRN